MATTTADTLLTHGNIDENFLSEYFTGDVTENNAVPSNIMYIGDGIDTIEPKQDDKKNSKAYYNTGGQEVTTITGSTRSVDISGDRSYGDPAQDMIAGLAIILFITLKHDFMQTANLAPQEISIHAIGNALLSSDKYGYVLPFEAVSILLLACIIGGIMIARKR